MNWAKNYNSKNAINFLLVQQLTRIVYSIPCTLHFVYPLFFLHTHVRSQKIITLKSIWP